MPAIDRHPEATSRDWSLRRLVALGASVDCSPTHARRHRLHLVIGAGPSVTSVPPFLRVEARSVPFRSVPFRSVPLPLQLPTPKSSESNGWQRWRRIFPRVRPRRRGSRCSGASGPA